MENPIQTTIRIIGRRWKPIILWHLTEQTCRFGELKKRIPDASQKMLTQQLRELEDDGLVHRKVFAQVPPKVEYSITEYGKTGMELLGPLYEWGKQHQETFPGFPEELKSKC